MSKGVDMSRGWVRTPPNMRPQGYPLRHGIQWDTAGKQAVRILLECFLVTNAFTICTFRQPLPHILVNGAIM